MKILEKTEIERFLASNEEWRFEEDAIHANLLFDNFQEAFAFMTKVAFEAEIAGHHPEWTNVYNRLQISLSTHDAGNKVTDKDTTLASTISTLYKS